jgi:hypothetical protein
VTNRLAGVMSDPVEFADVPALFERWLAGLPLAERSRREYARNVRAYCAARKAVQNPAGVSVQCPGTVRRVLRGDDEAALYPTWVIAV